MTEHLKCKHCHKPLTYNDSVFISISRYDEYARRTKKLVFCTNCWDHTTHFTHSVKVTPDDIKKLDNTDSYDSYYHLDQLPDPECTVKVKAKIKLNSIYGICASRDNVLTCGNCNHLIFRDYRHNEGLCNLTRLHRCFYDPCVHEEEMS